jgi:response regulator RpfG family c-di-GMP phosphodiesterase
MSGARLLIVDDELAHRNLMVIMLEEAGMTCTAVPNATEALSHLREQPVEAVIADLNMPGLSGMDLLAEVRRHYPDLVYLMATGLDDVQAGVRAMRQGADDYLIKPLQIDEVMVSLERAFRKHDLEQEVEHYRQNLEKLVCKRTVQLQSALGRVEQNYADTLDALGAGIDLRDGQTGGHSRRVALYAMNIMAKLSGTVEQHKSLVMGAWLHDIGKLAIPDAILLKPGPLTKAERKVMENHVQIGYDLIKRVSFLADAAEIVLTHHEHWDGNGYPNGLAGSDIPLNSRIFAVADANDAITSERPYRSALSFQFARNEIERRAGTQFDPEVVTAFLTIPTERWEAVREQAAVIDHKATFTGIFHQQQEP